MDKTELLQKIRDAHAPIAAAAAALSDDELGAGAPGIPGWSRKDVLAHLEYWHRRSAATVAGVRSGADPFADAAEPYDVDAINARVQAESAGRPAADVRAGEAESLVGLLAAIEGATDRELFGTGVVPWLAEPLWRDIEGNTWGHYPLHAANLAAD